MNRIDTVKNEPHKVPIAAPSMPRRGMPSLPRVEDPGERHVHEDAEEAGQHDGPRFAQSDEVAGQHALRQKDEGPEHEDAEEAELQPDQVRAVSCPAEPQVNEWDQGEEHRIEDHGQEEPLGNGLDAALGPARAVVLGSQCIHVADHRRRKGR